MKCRGGFSPPDRLDNGLGLGKHSPLQLLHLILKGRGKPVPILLLHLILKGRGMPAATLVAYNSQRPVVYPTVGGPTLLQPGTTWPKTLLSDELSANTLHLSDTHLWP
jgi:hypothetical protein